MKVISILATIFAASFILCAQPAVREAEVLGQEIRELERSEAAAVLRGNITALEVLWHEDFTVNAPHGHIVKGRARVLDGVRSGAIQYSLFVREVESLVFYENTAFAMGLETVTPSGKSPLAGQTVRRRYTNIWLKKNGKWLLVARQSSVICPK